MKFAYEYMGAVEVFWLFICFSLRLKETKEKVSHINNLIVLFWVYCQYKNKCNSHEIKRCLLLGRRARTNVDNILKSKDLILLTNVHIIKAMVFQ